MSRDVRTFAQWPKPRTQVPAPLSSYVALVLDADGQWQETNDPMVVPDGVYVINADGELDIDDDPEAIGALRARFVGADTVVY